MHSACLCMERVFAVSCVACLCLSLSNFSSASSPLSLSLVSSHLCGQALERQKEYFDCIRNERDELRDELADIKEKAKAGEVGPLSLRKDMRLEE